MPAFIDEPIDFACLAQAVSPAALAWPTSLSKRNDNMLAKRAYNFF
jgi:hypothetical protein